MPPIALWWWTGTGAASAARAERLRLALERPGAWREHIWWGAWAYAAPRPHPAPIPPGRWYTLEGTLDPGGCDCAQSPPPPPKKKKKKKKGGRPGKGGGFSRGRPAVTARTTAMQHIPAGTARD